METGSPGRESPAWLRIARDTGLTIIPATYVIGFLSWGVYGAEQGLGFLRLDAAHYLAAGTLLGLLAAASLFFDYWMVQAIQEKSAHWPANWKSRIRRGLREALAQILALLAPLALVAVVSTSIPILRLSPWGWFEVVFLAVFMSFAMRIVGLEVLEWWQRPKESRSEASLLGGHSSRFKTYWALSWALLLLLLFSGTLLPSMSPEFGGAMPRHAYLDVDSGLVAAETQAAIFGEVAANLTGVARTVELTVLYAGSDLFLVRVRGQDSASDPIYEIRAQAVHAVVWKD